MKSLYSKKIMDRFLNPRNMGKLANPDGIGDTENLRCGDIMRIGIKVEANVIKDIKFETLGCAPAIASSDMICELAKGKTLEKSKKIKYKDIADKLGELPPPKIHCTQLAEKALKMAIEDYEKKQ